MSAYDVLNKVPKLLRRGRYPSIPSDHAIRLPFSLDVLAPSCEGGQAAVRGDSWPLLISLWTPAQLAETWKPPCVMALVKVF